MGCIRALQWVSQESLDETEWNSVGFLCKNYNVLAMATLLHHMS